VVDVTGPSRLRVAGLVLALGWLVPFVVHEVRTPQRVDAAGIAVGRDFLSFYGAGRIVLAGEGIRVYDPDLQRRTQDAILAPATQRGHYHFINPAPFAVFYAPLTALPYRAAFYLHAGLMLMLFLLGMRALAAQLPALRQEMGVAALLGATSYPLVHTILGGQNTALALALLAWAYASIQAGHDRRGGLALGLLLFKPQYALTFLLLFATRRKWTILLWAAATGAALYAIGGLACGWAWPLRMLESMTGYYRINERIVSGPTHIALLEALDWSVIVPLERLGAHRNALLAIKSLGWLGVGAALVYAIARWRDARPGLPRFALDFSLASAASLVTALHAQYYDAGLLLLPILLLLDHHTATTGSVRAGTRAILILAYVLFPLVILGKVSHLVRFQPGVALPVAVLVWAARARRRHAEGGLPATSPVSTNNPDSA
jgi:hypothetical protein